MSRERVRIPSAPLEVERVDGGRPSIDIIYNIGCSNIEDYMECYGSPGREGIPDSPSSLPDSAERVEHLAQCAGEEEYELNEFESENPNTPLSEAIFHRIQKI